MGEGISDQSGTTTSLFGRATLAKIAVFSRVNGFRPLVFLWRQRPVFDTTLVSLFGSLAGAKEPKVSERENTDFLIKFCAGGGGSGAGQRANQGDA